MLAAMREAIHEGRFGRPVQLTLVAGQHFPTYRPTYRDTYYKDRAAGGGAVQDALTHHLNAVEWLATGVSSAMRPKVTETPLYFERGEGPYFYDVDGRRLLDYTLGWGPLIAGNNHSRITSAVIR